MELNNDILLRPRFMRYLPVALDEVRQRFTTNAAARNNYKTSIVDDHIFIRILKKDQHFWSPQLHLELRENPDSGTDIHGLFGPSPTVWTFFMFLHFVAAGLFITAGIWCYTQHVLDNSILFPVIAMVVLVVIWFTLYTLGQFGKKKGHSQMHELYQYMKECLEVDNFHRNT
ncbi:MAG: GTP-binding protein [Nonlabens sp.]|uniref:GTP-binding protein n=1 Tax=Nonlabens sp. TaxID=1888209 RepID=UPI003EF81DA4